MDEKGDMREVLRAEGPARSRAASRLPPSFWLLLFIVCIVLFYGVVYPNIGLLTASFGAGTGSWGLDLYATTLAQPSTREAIVSSLVLSLATTAGCALVGGGLALLLNRVDVPGRRYFSAVAVAPILLPPLVGTIAFIFLFGESGMVTRALVRAFGLSEPPYSLKGFWAVLAFHVYTIYPYFYVFVSSALKRVDPALEEAARTLGAPPWYRFRRVLMPALRGALGAGALATFMTSMASFSAPYLFGGDLRVLTLQVYEAKINNEQGLAVVQTVILACLSLASLVVFARLERTAAGGGTKGVSARRTVLRSPIARAAALAVGGVVSVCILLPHAAVVVLSFAQVGAWTTQILPPSYTLGNYARLFSDKRFTDPIVNSTFMATTSAAANLVFGIAAAYLVSRYRFRGRGVVTMLLLIPWALPGTVLAYQLVTAYSQSSPLTAGAALAGSFWLLPMLYFLRNMPLVVRSVGVNLAQIDPNLEPAARSLGASRLGAVRRVVLPLVLPGALAGSLLAFSLALGEFVASIVAYVYSNRPISIGIDQSLRQGDLGAAAAYGVILIAAIGVTLGLGAGLEERAGRLGG
jgi:iron(III) transport system permease protein